MTELENLKKDLDSKEFEKNQLKKELDNVKADFLFEKNINLEKISELDASKEIVEGLKSRELLYEKEIQKLKEIVNELKNGPKKLSEINLFGNKAELEKDFLFKYFFNPAMMIIIYLTVSFYLMSQWIVRRIRRITSVLNN